MSQTRRLAAILAADVAGYSRLMGADEEGTLERLKALRRELRRGEEARRAPTHCDDHYRVRRIPAKPVLCADGEPGPGFADSNPITNEDSCSWSSSVTRGA